ncbi:MAG: hypothetical protein C4547_06355 [Phycisphaerales bacterium]|nr:MAG: hypothetical protein C4547_06355 [Phycisphaerales bacterium]
MTPQSIRLDDRDYVVIERAEYDRLRTLAKIQTLPAMPDLPGVGADGNYPRSSTPALPSPARSSGDVLKPG